MKIPIIQFRYAIKSAAHHLSIAGAAALALALAIGASGAIFNFGGLRALPFVNIDSQIETTRPPLGKVDFHITARGLDSTGKKAEAEKNLQPCVIKLNHKACDSKRAAGMRLLGSRFIKSKLLMEYANQGE